VRETAEAVTVTITRARLNRHRVAPGERVIRYTYSWTASDGSHIIDYTCPDGTVRTGVNTGSYGTSLGSLVDMLRRKYRGRRLTIVRSWEN
jgi:hypothetical protein